MSRAGGNALMKLLSGDKKKKKAKKGAIEELGLVIYIYIHIIYAPPNPRGSSYIDLFYEHLRFTVII